MRRSRAWWIVRAGLPIVALGLALAAFRAGVGLSQRAHVPSASLPTQIYYAIGLFVLGGLDLGLPQGGPAWAQSMLWSDYFLAPLITTGAVIEGALRLLQPHWLVRLGLRNHVVIVGAGRLGMLMLEAVRGGDVHRKIVMVDRDPLRANVELAQSRFGARFVAGDVRHAATLAQLELEHARAVLLLTDDDLVNLETAWHVHGAHPGVRVAAHVADIATDRALAHVEQDARVHVFNGHRIAAERLYREHLQAYFASTDERDVVVLAGFGRFGQTILEYLRTEAHDQIQRAVVIDVAAHRSIRLFRSQVPAAQGCDIVAIDGDVSDPETWEHVELALREHSVAPVLVLGTDDDRANLRAAVALRAAHPRARIFVRCLDQSAFTRALSARLDFQVLAVEDMMRSAFAEAQSKWLG